MIRLSRHAALGAALFAAFLVTVFIAILSPGTPAAAVGTAPGGTAIVHPAASTPAPTPTCTACVTPHDAICWELVGPCGIPVVVSNPQTHPITVHYYTVAMTAQPNVDYVPVQDAVATIQPGRTVTYVYIQLLAGSMTPPGKQFAVAFHNIVGGQLTRNQAIVTLSPQGTAD